MPAFYGQWRLICDQPVPPELIGQARKMIGSMLETGGISAKSVRNTDGSTIHVLIVNGVPQVTFTLGAPANEEAPVVSTEWVPRGFVVYPAWHGNVFGVGLPIVQQDSDPYGTLNMSPGLNVARWTSGGPCGEVLVSADTEAAYPPDVFAPAPLLADATRGPQFLGDQTNYDKRAPDGAWQSYRLELAPFVAHYADENTTVAQNLFETVNTTRTNAGATKATLRFRGFARPAEIAASVFVTAGSDAKTSTSYPLAYQSDADRLTKEGYLSDWTGSLTSFTRTNTGFAQEFRAASQTPADAVAAWQSQTGSLLTANFSSGVWADVGYRGGYSVLALSPRDRWIQAGNQSWQSEDTQLPPISWHGFASQNLACETYPAVYAASGNTMAPQLDFNFTDANGNCWLSYPRAAANTPYDTAKSEPAMGRHIYCRGRSIALAPTGGLVWGACVQRVGGNDRLIALTWQLADQSNDTLHEGYTRYLRMWWADIPPRTNGQRLAPQLTICGTASDDPWAWQGGQLIDLGSMPPATNFTAASGANSLMQTSQWRFATDGTRAVCLRSYGAYTDYVVTADPSKGEVLPYVLPLTPTPARTVELLFSASTTALTTQLVVHDFTAGVTNYMADTPANEQVQMPGPTGQPDITVYDTGVMPMSVDYYSDSYQLIYAYRGTYQDDQGYVQYGYTCTGGASSTFISETANRVLVGCSVQTSLSDFVPSRTVVLDTQTATFATDGLTSGACWPFSGNVHGVKLCRGGAVVSTDYYPIPDGAVVAYTSLVNDNTLAGKSSWGEILFCQSATMQGFYAARFGETVYGYQLMPLPYTVLAMNAQPANCSPTWAEAISTDTSHQVLGIEALPRGGKAVSTAPMPANDWLIFAKVV